ncbi:MAG: hypothetical protein KDA84_02280 [Planctomycetaceae bacterium]|nr:hypothetical protein [Planctomycetaceae bacterium]
MARFGPIGLNANFQQLLDYGLALLGLIIVLGIGGWAISWIRSQLADDEGSTTEDHQLLSQIGDLRDQGDLSEEEYRSIKGRLVVHLNETMSANEGKRTTHSISDVEKSQDSPPSETNGGNPNMRDATSG